MWIHIQALDPEVLHLDGEQLFRNGNLGIAVPRTQACHETHLLRMIDATLLDISHKQLHNAGNPEFLKFRQQIFLRPIMENIRKIVDIFDVPKIHDFPREALTIMRAARPSSISIEFPKEPPYQ